MFNFSFIHSLPVYPKQFSSSNCINICKLEGDEKQERFKCGDVVCLKRQILNWKEMWQTLQKIYVEILGVKG